MMNEGRLGADYEVLLCKIEYRWFLITGRSINNNYQITKGATLMKVKIKDLQVSMGLGTNGIELDVYSPDGKAHKGDLRIGKAVIEWCKGKTHGGNGIKNLGRS